MIDFYAKSKKYGFEIEYGNSYTAIKLEDNMPYLNMVFGEYSLKNHQRIKEFYQDLQYCWCVNKNEEHTAKALLENGFTSEPAEAVMMLSLNSYHLNRETDITIREVDSDQMLNIWVKIASEVYGVSEEGVKKFCMILFKEIRRDVKAFIGYAPDGKGVATSFVTIHNDVAAIYWVGVIEQYRKKSIGSDITKASIEYAQKQKGVKLACLQSFPTSINLYKKIGFEIVEEVENYWPKTK